MERRSITGKIKFVIMKSWISDRRWGIKTQIKLKRQKKLAIILGTEGDGLASQTIADCDYTVKIPMSHGVDSLNVAAASAVAFWELGHR